MFAITWCVEPAKKGWTTDNGQLVQLSQMEIERFCAYVGRKLTGKGVHFFLSIVQLAPQLAYFRSLFLLLARIQWTGSWYKAQRRTVTCGTPRKKVHESYDNDTFFAHEIEKTYNLLPWSPFLKVTTRHCNCPEKNVRRNWPHSGTNLNNDRCKLLCWSHPSNLQSRSFHFRHCAAAWKGSVFPTLLICSQKDWRWEAIR